MRLLLAAALAFPLLAAAAAAQPQPLEGMLALGPPLLVGEGEDGMFPGGSGDVQVAWTLSFPDAAAAAVELSQQGSAVTVALACDLPVKLTAGSVAVAYVPGQAEYVGVVTVKYDATGVRGYTKTQCTASGSFEGATAAAEATSEGTLRIVYDAALNVTTPTPSRQAGPQKQVLFPIDVRNDGDAPVLVRFELAGDAPKGKWAVLLPETILIAAGDTQVVQVVVATPYKTGANKGSTDFTVNAVPGPADEDVQGQPVAVPLHAGVQGFYVPGPPAALLVVGLAALAAALRRR